MQGHEAVIEPYVMAREVSVTVVQAPHGPIALLPTEISLVDDEDLVTQAQLELDAQHAANEVRCPDTLGETSRVRSLACILLEADELSSS